MRELLVKVVHADGIVRMFGVCGCLSRWLDLRFKVFDLEEIGTLSLRRVTTNATNSNRREKTPIDLELLLLLLFADIRRHYYEINLKDSSYSDSRSQDA